MKIEHVAIWVLDLELMKTFYVKNFNGKAGPKYYNATKQFSSYFITFASGCRLELMHKPKMVKSLNAVKEQELGLAHVAIAVGDKLKVNHLTYQLKQNGYTVLSEPRTTGDGYYESVVLDPENNQIEITI